jgi:hypothetical protein
MHVQKVSSAACPLLGVIVPSKLFGNEDTSVYMGGPFKKVNSISLCQITASSLNGQHIEQLNTTSIYDYETRESDIGWVSFLTTFR